MKTVESPCKVFYYRRSILHQVRIFNPVIVAKTYRWNDEN